jgi:glutaredoxin
MKLLTTTAGLVLLLCAAGAQAQMYKWVDEKGVTHFSDQPAPPNAKKVEQKALSIGGAEQVLPYELSLAVRNFPVTLYTMPSCAPCDSGRKLLQTRGIPFTEKTVDTAEDQAVLTAAGGNQLPLLLVGRNKLTGFEPGQWNGALTDANYPLTRQLPQNYRAAKAESAAARKPSQSELKAAETARLAAEAAEARAEAERVHKQAEMAKNKPDFQF